MGTVESIIEQEALTRDDVIPEAYRTEHAPIADPETRRQLAELGVTFDDEGRPTNVFSTEEAFYRWDCKLIERFGEEYRVLTNIDRKKRGWKLL